MAAGSDGTLQQQTMESVSINALVEKPVVFLNLLWSVESRVNPSLRPISVLEGETGSLTEHGNKLEIAKPTSIQRKWSPKAANVKAQAGKYLTHTCHDHDPWREQLQRTLKFYTMLVTCLSGKHLSQQQNNTMQLLTVSQSAAA
jgi:hypothetical protein